MECAAGHGTDCGAGAGEAYGQTDQCRVSHRGLDPAGQYHDAGAGHSRDAARVAPAGIERQRAIAVTTSHSGGGADAGRSEKAAGAKTPARDGACAGFDCTGTGSRRLE